jgi:hypothetical protein
MYDVSTIILSPREYDLIPLPRKLDEKKGEMELSTQNHACFHLKI